MLFDQDKVIIASRLKTLGFTNYRSYQKSSLWQEFRASIPKKSCYCCKKNRKEKLQLHHLTYMNLGEELPVDVCWLCDVCHKQVHLLYMSYAGKREWNVGLLGFATEYLRVSHEKKKADSRIERRGEGGSPTEKRKSGRGVVLPLERGASANKIPPPLPVTYISRPMSWRR